MERMTYRIHEEQLIKGYIFNIILFQEKNYYLIDLKVYADGYIDCLGEINIKSLKELLDSGKLIRNLPQGESLFVPYIGYIQTNQHLQPSYNDERFIEIVEDSIKKLNSPIENYIAECILLFKFFLINPKELYFEEIKKKYFLIPEKNKVFFEISPEKDPLIKLIEKEFKFTKEEREYLLKNYYDGEWIELK